MGQGHSKSELLYLQVSYGNVEAIKALHGEGAGLEWRDREGKTPLIVACMNLERYDVARTLIGLGANVNAYRPGYHAGTPLHHAAKRGIESIVKLLLLHGANALVLNDDCQTALDIARAKGHSKVVRTIESHLCLFSGWLREFHGPGFLEVVAPQLVSRKVWVVVLPVGSCNHMRPYKLELAIYSSLQDAQPQRIIALWKANLEEVKLHTSDPSVTIVDNTTKTRIKLGPVSENNNQQLKWFSDACKGIPWENPAFLRNMAVLPPIAPPTADDLEMAIAINSSFHSAIQERSLLRDTQPNFEASSSNGGVNRTKLGLLAAPNPITYSGESVQEGNMESHENVSVAHTYSGLDFIPSATPPVDGPIHYPTIDLSPADILSSSVMENLPKEEENAVGRGCSSCVICLDAPAEGACIPCGHVAGCMSCLKEVQAKKWGCPVCRVKLEQVIKLYHV